MNKEQELTENMERHFVLLLFLSVPTLSLESQVTSEVSDFRSVKVSVDRFSDPNVRHFTEILFDYANHQFIVGARDAIFRLSLEGLNLLEKSIWKAQKSTIDKCTTKGQTELNCRNYIKVLVEHDGKLFVCGTNAFRPSCSWRDMQGINNVRKYIDGRGKCPHAPDANSTALMMTNGDYYIASSTDFSGNDHAIYRMSGTDFRSMLRTVQYNSFWLDQPQFVATFETEKFVYFLFRETAVEFINCGKAIYSRIARICKDDQGGKRVLKNNWTTFLKARLNCSVAGEYPFYYNEIQSAHYIPSEDMIYAVFGTGKNDIAGSAVCNFNLSAVENAFRGPFKTRDGPDFNWKSVNDDHEHFECRSNGERDFSTVDSSKYQFVDQAVMSANNGPIFKVNHVTQQINSSLS